MAAFSLGILRRERSVAILARRSAIFAENVLRRSLLVLVLEVVGRTRNRDQSPR